MTNKDTPDLADLSQPKQEHVGGDLSQPNALPYVSLRTDSDTRDHTLWRTNEEEKDYSDEIIPQSVAGGDDWEATRGILKPYLDGTQPEAAKVALDALDRLVFDATSGTDDIKSIIADRDLIRAALQTPASDGMQETFRWMAMFDDGSGEVFRTKSGAEVYARDAHAKCEVFPIFRALKQSTAK